MLDLNNLKWYEISETEEQATDEDGNIFTREKDMVIIPLYCNVCKNIISTVEDIDSMKSIECCSDCKEVYYHPNREKWDSGWRPEK